MENMCGIAGILDFGKKVKINTLVNMTQIIKYRGPDDEGYQLFDKNGMYKYFGNDTVQDIKRITCDIKTAEEGRFFLGFGHRRLSILDVSSIGHQPMTRNNVTITYNGEIYNYIEIREKLKRLGYKFETETDTEVILYAYQEWKEECVKYFNGMWAFVIYDQNESKLFCSRDRLGVKPFYYFLSQNENKFIFASEIKQIVQDSNIERKMNEKLLSINLIYGLTDYNNETLIKNIFQLEAGHNLIIYFDTKKERIVSVLKKKYWDLNVKRRIKGNYSEIVGKSLEKSIKYRLRSDVEIGALLSGGLDSSSLVALSMKQLNKNIRFNTFTSYYPENEECDESYYAHVINKYFGCEENFINPKIENIEKEFEDIVWHMEGFSGFSSLGAAKVIEAAAKKGVRVILNGQGGDETLFGYERYYVFYLLDLLKKLKIGRFIKEFRKIVKCSKLSTNALIKMFVYFAFPIVRNGRNIFNAKKYLKKEIIKKLDYKSIKKILYPNNLEELQYNELKHGQLTHILRMDDRGYMAHSIESRVPFVDYRYIEKVVAIPPEEKIAKGYTKILLRNYMDNKMPKEITWRKNKLGFAAPVERFIENFDKKYIEELLCTAKSRKYFNTGYILENYDKIKCSKIMSDFLTVEIFMRKFGVQVDE